MAIKSDQAEQSRTNLAREIAEIGPWMIFQTQGEGPAETFAISDDGQVRDINVNDAADLHTIERALALGIGIEPITSEQVEALWALEQACQEAFLDVGVWV